MSSVGTTVPVPRKEQVLPQGTQSPGVGECEKKIKKIIPESADNIYQTTSPLFIVTTRLV